MKFFDSFRALGFSQKEAEIYLALYKLGTQPASTLSRYVGMERTFVYRTLMELAQKGLASITERWGVKHFFIPDISVLRKYIEVEHMKYGKMHQEFGDIEVELQSHKQGEMLHTPKITLYEGGDGVKNCYEGIASDLLDHGYKTCKLFASNTLSSQSGKSDTLNQYANEFFSMMQKEHLSIDTVLGNGIWLMESIGRTQNIEELRNLPATNESIQIFITGDTTYIIIFREIPFAMKIASEELTNMLYFMFRNMAK